MNYLLPKRGILSMHASANEGKDRIRAKNYALKNLTSDGYRMVSIKLSLGFHEVCHQSPSVSPLYFALFVFFFSVSLPMFWLTRWCMQLNLLTAGWRRDHFFRVEWHREDYTLSWWEPAANRWWWACLDKQGILLFAPVCCTCRTSLYSVW